MYNHLCNVNIHMQAILGHVNYNVKQAELHQRLLEYKSRLDLSALEKSNSPIALMYKVKTKQCVKYYCCAIVSVVQTCVKNFYLLSF